MSGLPQNARGQTATIATTRYSRTERYEVNSVCYETNSSCINSRAERGHRASGRLRYCGLRFIRSIDPLAQRDEWALVHQGKTVNATDFAPRYNWRWCYYFKDSEQLIQQPAYVGSMQTALRRLGYYCGPVDGVFTPQVAEAIARLQKNYSMRVTGTLTTPVRRALHLP